MELTQRKNLFFGKKGETGTKSNGQENSLARTRKFTF
jgi:hypothetical protein